MWISRSLHNILYTYTEESEFSPYYSKRWNLIFTPNILHYLIFTTYYYTRFSKVHIPYRAKKSYLDMGVLKKIDFQWENRQIRKIFTWLDTLVGRQFRFTFCDVLMLLLLSTYVLHFYSMYYVCMMLKVNRKCKNSTII